MGAMATPFTHAPARTASVHSRPRKAAWCRQSSPTPAPENATSAEVRDRPCEAARYTEGRAERTYPMRDALSDWLDHGPLWARALIALAGIAVMLGAFLALGIVLDWLGLLSEPTTECAYENNTGQCMVEIPLEPAER